MKNRKDWIARSLERELSGVRVDELLRARILAEADARRHAARRRRTVSLAAVAAVLAVMIGVGLLVRAPERAAQRDPVLSVGELRWVWVVEGDACYHARASCGGMEGCAARFAGTGAGAGPPPLRRVHRPAGAADGFSIVRWRARGVGGRLFATGVRSYGDARGSCSRTLAGKCAADRAAAGGSADDSGRAHAGSDSRAHAGSDSRAHTGSDSRAHTGSDSRAHAGSDGRAHAGNDRSAAGNREVFRWNGGRQCERGAVRRNGDKRRERGTVRSCGGNARGARGAARGGGFRSCGRTGGAGRRSGRRRVGRGANAGRFPEQRLDDGGRWRRALPRGQRLSFRGDGGRACCSRRRCSRGSSPARRAPPTCASGRRRAGDGSTPRATAPAWRTRGCTRWTRRFVRARRSVRPASDATSCG